MAVFAAMVTRHSDYSCLGEREFSLASFLSFAFFRLSNHSHISKQIISLLIFPSLL